MLIWYLKMKKATPPVIILVKPQLGENIGMCARAMLNCGFEELRLVSPRDGWPNPAALSAASGAVYVIENAKVFNTTEEAIADLEFIVATTARSRDMVKEILLPSEAVEKITGFSGACGVMFGPERTGLENEDVCLANALLNIPLNPDFSSLNISQAVLLVCYEWISSNKCFNKIEALTENDSANKADIDFLVKRLEGELELSGFFSNEQQKPTVLKNLRNFFFRISPTKQEIRTLHGIIISLTGRK